MVNTMSDAELPHKGAEGKLSPEVTDAMDCVVKDYYEAESWQFSGCWD